MIPLRDFRLWWNDTKPDIGNDLVKGILVKTANAFSASNKFTFFYSLFFV